MPKIFEEDAIPIDGTAVGIAINLIDLDRVDQLIRQIMLAGKLDLSKDNVIKVDKNRFDEMAVAFVCEPLVAACICDTIRGHDRRAGDYPTRVYLRRAVAWVKVAGHEMLSVVKGEKVILNPKLFGTEEEEVIRESSPLPARAVKFGG